MNIIIVIKLKTSSSSFRNIIRKRTVSVLKSCTHTTTLSKGFILKSKIFEMNKTVKTTAILQIERIVTRYVAWQPALPVNRLHCMLNELFIANSWMLLSVAIL